LSTVREHCCRHEIPRPIIQSLSSRLIKDRIRPCVARNKEEARKKPASTREILACQINDSRRMFLFMTIAVKSLLSNVTLANPYPSIHPRVRSHVHVIIIITRRRHREHSRRRGSVAIYCKAGERELRSRPSSSSNY